MDQKDRCRLCLNEENLEYDLFASENRKDSLAYKLEEVLRVTLTEMKASPSKVCTECMACINAFERFRETVKLNQDQIFTRFGVEQLKCEPTVFVKEEDTVVRSESPQSPPKKRGRPRKEVPIDTQSDDGGQLSEDCDGNLSHLDDEETKSEQSQYQAQTETEEDSDSTDVSKKTSAKVKRKLRQKKVRDNDGAEGTPGKRKRVKSNLDAFSDIMREMKLLDCNECGTKDMKNWEELRNHYRDSHDGNGHVVCCGKKISERYVLYDHLQFHIYGAQYSCTECDKKFRARKALVQHIKVVHEQKGLYSVECEQCGRKFKHRNTLKQHLITHSGEEARIFKCDLCPQSFKQKSGLRKHAKDLHSDKRKSFICDECGISCATLATLQVHRRNHNRAKEACEICGKYVLNMSIHVNLAHSNVDESVACDECGSVLKNKHNLYGHRRLVHGKNIKMYPCTVCSKSCKSRTKLKEHLSIHTGVKEFSCYFCTEEFAASTSRSKHMKLSHAEEYERWKIEKYFRPT